MGEGVSTELDLELLNEYNQWVIEQKYDNATSPEKFLIDRAKTQALDRLIEIQEIIEGLDSQADESDKAIAYRQIVEVMDGL